MYLLRLDDASEHWDIEKWNRMHDLLKKYNISPIFAIIPHNEDPKLLEYPVDAEFFKTVHMWIDEGWTPALHGFNHVLNSECGGINPINQRSEFAGVDLLLQKEKIASGCAIFEKNDIKTKIFVAPAHTFDRNTLRALKEESDIRIISDTIANDVYYEEGFYFIPQQSGMVRKMQTKVTTFCYHPNTLSDDEFLKLEKFIEKHRSEFVSFEDVPLVKRTRGGYDKILRKIYFVRKEFGK